VTAILPIHAPCAGGSGGLQQQLVGWATAATDTTIKLWQCPTASSVENASAAAGSVLRPVKTLAVHSEGVTALLLAHTPQARGKKDYARVRSCHG
jgi:hypothetical protein